MILRNKFTVALLALSSAGCGAIQPHEAITQQYDIKTQRGPIRILFASKDVGETVQRGLVIYNLRMEAQYNQNKTHTVENQAPAKAAYRPVTPRSRRFLDILMKQINRNLEGDPAGVIYIDQAEADFWARGMLYYPDNNHLPSFLRQYADRYESLSDQDLSNMVRPIKK